MSNPKPIVSAFFLVMILSLVACNPHQSSTGTHELEPQTEITTESKTIKDIDGNVYKILKVGKKEWMCGDLEVKHFLNGDPVPFAESNESWEMAGRNGTPAWCYHKNGQFVTGVLYNWYAVSDPRGLIPKGWKASTGFLLSLNDSIGKITNGGVTGLFNQYCIQFEGGRKPNGDFASIGYGFWWSPNEKYIDNTSFIYSLDNVPVPTITSTAIHKGTGASVRCVKLSLSEFLKDE